MSIQAHNNDHRVFASQPIAEAVVEGMWPFQMGEMITDIQYDIDYDKYRLLVEVFFKDAPKSHRLFATVPFPRDDFLDFPERATYEIMAELTRALRFRPIEGLLAPQIHLGEN